MIPVLPLISDLFRPYHTILNIIRKNSKEFVLTRFSPVTFERLIQRKKGSCLEKKMSLLFADFYSILPNDEIISPISYQAIEQQNIVLRCV